MRRRTDPPAWPAAVLTVSDRSARGERPDAGGPAVERALARAGFRVAAREVVDDDRGRIASALRRLSRRAALVLTTGGTGLGPRDVTPEATRRVLDREVPGIPEAMRAVTSRKVPSAVLSRAVSGLRGRTLIVNLPGNPRGAAECLEVILPLLPHALTVLRSPACDAHP